MRKKAILGLGLSGKAVLRYLLERGEEPLLIDKKVKTVEGFSVCSEEKASLDGVETLIISPGIAKEHPLVKEAKKREITITSEMEIALKSLQKEKVTIFAITGSCGKSTTTSLVTHILNASGRKAKSFGNIGYPLLNYWQERVDYAVLEISSSQLIAMKSGEYFDAGVLLNIFPNHLDYHGSMQRYIEAKLHIADLLKKGAPLFISKKLEHYFAKESTICFFDKENVASISLKDYRDRRFGEFLGDRENCKAAFLLCERVGLTAEECSYYSQSYQKPEHRFEFVRALHGVTYINDSKATSVHATVKAIEAVHGPVILLAGGQGKGVDFSPWQEAFKGRVRKVVLFGEAKGMLAQLLPFSEEVESLEEAVEVAAQCAKKGECVLLSPGCASFDQFVNYAERGKRFKELVQELEGEI